MPRSSTTFTLPPLPGGGPWRILPNCPGGLLHNTRNAAVSLGAKSRRCICPRALDLLAAYREKQRVSELRRYRARRELEQEFAPVSGQMPDLSAGRCATHVSGPKIVDAYMGRRNGGAAAHKKMCTSCPLQQVCGRAALELEYPAGAWGGMYGGMSPAERQKARRKLSEQRTGKA